jgi:hypothetical protein
MFCKDWENRLKVSNKDIETEVINLIWMERIMDDI